MNIIPPEAERETLHVLHLEDNELESRIVASLLADARLGAQVRRVFTREDFVAALLERDYDLILSDHTMPAFDGLSALAIAREKAPAVPFIFVSGTIGEERAIESLKRGATDYVLKAHLDRLVPAVKRALRDARERCARARAEEANRHLHLAFQHAAEALCLADLQGRIEIVNRAWAELHGYAIDELLGESVRIFHSERQLRDQVAPLAEQARQRGRAAGEVARRRKDGRTFPSWTTMSIVRDAQGTPRGLVLGARDLGTERRRDRQRAAQVAIARIVAETPALASATAILQALCSGADWDLAELWTVDTERDRLVWAAAWQVPELRDTPAARLSTAGRDLDFGRGTGLLGRVWASGAMEWIDQSVAVTAGLQSALLLPLRGAAGSVLGVLACFGREPRARDTGFLEIAEGLSTCIGAFLERVREHRVGSPGEGWLATVLEALPVALYTAEADGARLTWVSPEVERITGFPAERLVEEPQLRWSRIHGEDQQHAWRTLSGVRNAGRAELHYRWVRPDGSCVRLLEHAVLAYDARGERAAVLGIWVQVSSPRS